jgi:hypothetical protein
LGPSPAPAQRVGSDARRAAHQAATDAVLARQHHVRPEERRLHRDKQVSPNAALYDTTLSGNSNAGHDTPEFLGDIDWANDPKARYETLEYLETL